MRYHRITVLSLLKVNLTMPVRSKSFSSFKLHPIFEMNLPEGYLLSVIKRHFSEIIGSDDFAVLQLISNSVNGRINYNKKESLKKKPLLVLADITESKNDNLFDELLNKFALQTAISGVQPKVLAPMIERTPINIRIVYCLIHFLKTSKLLSPKVARGG